MTYQAFTGFRTVETFGGATFHVAEGVPNPWNVFPYLAVLTLIGFVADASIRLWRLGGGRRAVLVGGAIVLFLLAGGLQAALVDLDILKTPYMISWAYLAVLIAMAIDLNPDCPLAIFRDFEARCDYSSRRRGEAGSNGYH